MTEERHTEAKATRRSGQTVVTRLPAEQRQGWRQPPGARREARSGFSLGAPKKEPTLLTPRFPTSGLRNCSTTNFYCLRSPVRDHLFWGPGEAKSRRSPSCSFVWRDRLFRHRHLTARMMFPGMTRLHTGGQGGRDWGPGLSVTLPSRKRCRRLR